MRFDRVYGGRKATRPPVRRMLCNEAFAFAKPREAARRRLNRQAGRLPYAAFTLIELLTVIAIISIIAALVVGMSSGASRAKKDKRASADKAKYILMIENYHDKMGFYPPDNGFLAQLPVGVGFGSPQYEQYTATNQLLYELTGVLASNLSGNQTFIAFDSNVLATAQLTTVYNRGGIANSDPSQPPSFFNPPPNPNDYTNYPGPGVTFKGLTLPIDTAAGNPPKPVHLNFWHYDASTTNRHNPASYDLWIEYYIGNDKQGNAIIITNGNW